jgi:hypothetical protein
VNAEGGIQLCAAAVMEAEPLIVREPASGFWLHQTAVQRLAKSCRVVGFWG